MNFGHFSTNTMLLVSYKISPGTLYLTGEPRLIDLKEECITKPTQMGRFILAYSRRTVTIKKRVKNELHVSEMVTACDYKKSHDNL